MKHDLISVPEDDQFFAPQWLSPRLPWLVEPCKPVSLFDMLRVAAYKYVNIGVSLQWLKESMAARTTPERKEAGFYLIEQSAETIAKELRSIGCVSSAAAALRFQRDIRGLSNEGLEIRSQELREAITEEMKSQLFFHMPSERAKYYDEAEKMLSAEAQAKFPLALPEIRSAGNCFAFGSPTACVFHLMRAVEHGLRVVASKLRVKLPKTEIKYAEWSNIISAAEGKIAAIRSKPGRGARKLAELEKYQSFLKEFAAFKDVFRNNVMHSRADYLEPEALTVFLHVRGFLDRLANLV